MRKNKLSVFSPSWIEYSIVEYDYKFCKYRSIEKHYESEQKECDCHEEVIGKITSAFFHGAKTVFWMSEKQQLTLFDAENYLQRVGRTGRMGKIGTSVVLIPPRDGTTKDMEKITDVENKYKCEIKELPPFSVTETDLLPDDWTKMLDRS